MAGLGAKSRELGNCTKMAIETRVGWAYGEVLCMRRGSVLMYSGIASKSRTPVKKGVPASPYRAE